jgi:hypothetical protein
LFSLIATIKTVRPDLLQQTTLPDDVTPIPRFMPLEVRRSFEYVEGIGEPINACFLNKTNDPTGWYDFLILIDLLKNSTRTKVDV